MIQKFVYLAEQSGTKDCSLFLKKVDHMKVKKSGQPTPVNVFLPNAYNRQEYAKAYNISRPKLNSMIESKQVNVFYYNGGELIVAR